jgi:acetolactate synthase-1/2/3 large subunit
MDDLLANEPAQAAADATIAPAADVAIEVADVDDAAPLDTATGPAGAAEAETADAAADEVAARVALPAPADEPAAADAGPVEAPALEATAPDAQPVKAAPAAEAGPERTVGRYVAEALHGAGVRWAFTVPGESFLGLLDELPAVGIHVVGARHEGGAAFMAEAVGQLTGRPTLCLATRAVGGANLAIGIHTARQDSTPVIAVVGQVRRAMRGRESFQEAELATTVGGFARWAAEPTSVTEVPGALREALRHALGGRPGPVVLSFAEDLLDEPLPGPALPVAPPTTHRADPDIARAILKLVAAAERPVILAGGGVLRARCSSDLVQLAEQLRVPIVAAWRRGDAVPNDHPLYLGMTGYGAPAVVRERLEAADVILALGTRLGEVSTFGYAVPHAGQRWAHVDLEPRAGGAGLPRPDLALAADARSFVRASLELLRGAVLDAATVDARQVRNEADRAAWEAAAVVDDRAWAGPGVHPGRVVTMLRDVLPDNAIVTTDAGNMAGWLARGFRFRRPGTFIGPTSGAMGYGLPAAIAASLVHRDRPVVAWTGDGGFAMTMAELETAVRHKLRLVVLVLDNERYGTIRMHQDDRGVARPTATDLGPIDVAGVARALGAEGYTVTDDAGFEPALRAALEVGRPAVIHLGLDRRWVSVDRPATG